MNASLNLNILSISDIHLGHSRVPTEHILTSLEELLSDNERLQNLDLLILAGDVFDSLQGLPEAHIGAIQHFIIRLLRRCYQFNIVLRVLEGTPSHDRGQSQQFVILKEALEIDVDVRYVDAIEIEHHDRLGIDMLYIPDEYHATTEETLQEVQTLLANKGLEQVDLAIMHGMFPHQLPEGLKLPAHDPEAYLKIVRHYIFIGHVHAASQYDRILSQGSWDRLCHGEEEDKGCWLVEIRPEGDSITFIKNPHATIFKTISLMDISEDQVQYALNEVIAECCAGSHLRVQINRDHTGLPVLQSVMDRNPSINWTITSPKRAVDSLAQESLKASIYVPSAINATSIRALMQDRLEQQALDPAIASRILQRLQDMK